MLGFVEACKFKMNRTYYTLNFFFYRVMYDIVVIFWFSYVLYAYMLIKLFTLFILCAPVTVLQLLIFLISVNPSLTRNRKLRFRQLKKEITTQEQNDAMWSSDSESDQDRYESAQEMSSTIDESNENGAGQMMRDLGGPYEVEIRKPYKPVFICFVDLWFAISFCVFQMMRFVLGLKPGAISGQTQFMSFASVVNQLSFFIKFGFDLLVLHCLKKKGNSNNMNHSASTTKLYGWRLIYNFFLICTILYAQKNSSHRWTDFDFHVQEQLEIYEDSVFRRESRLILLLLPVTVIEIVLFFISVRPAYARDIWQTENLKRAIEEKNARDNQINTISHGWLKGQRNEQREEQCN